MVRNPYQSTGTMREMVSLGSHLVKKKNIWFSFKKPFKLQLSHYNGRPGWEWNVCWALFVKATQTTGWRKLAIWNLTHSWYLLELWKSKTQTFNWISVAWEEVNSIFIQGWWKKLCQDHKCDIHYMIIYE